MQGSVPTLASSLEQRFAACQQIYVHFSHQVAANNVFRNMAVGGGNYYEDVLYDGIDVDVRLLKQAAKR